MTPLLLSLLSLVVGVAAVWLWSYTRAIKGIGESLDVKAVEQKEVAKASEVIAKAKQEFEQKKVELDGESKEQVYARIKLRLIKSNNSVRPNSSSTPSSNN